jgi:exopolysaccharide biosynthesis polyprenyl glycosylphosphotransferase
MNFNNSRGIFILIIGDLFTYLFSLIITLAIRYEAIPSRTLLFSHIPSFIVLFLLFILISLSAGLYDKQAAFIRRQIRGSLLRVQIFNIFIGAMFFYLAPVGITPKANLVIYFIVSTILLFLWRTVMFPVISLTRKQKAVLVGKGDDVAQLFHEVNNSDRYGLVFRKHIAPVGTIEDVVSSIDQAVKESGALIVVADFHDKSIESAMPFLYSLVFSGVKIIDAGKLYESLFDRIPLSMVGERWLVENSSTSLGNRKMYDILKRLIDIAVASIGGVVSLILYPFIYFAIKLDDGGPIFISQERIGSNGKLVRIVKFRSMSGNDNGNYNSNGNTSFYVTKVGKFLRSSRLDELPQLWNVVCGDLSLVGPRSELPRLVSVYEKEISYYNARHLVKPGLSGWAQIYHEAHPHHSVATEDTKDKLSYDLYYIKNRSLTLDMRIILRTLQILLKRAGK